MKKSLLVILAVSIVVITIYAASFAGSAVSEMARQQVSLTGAASRTNPPSAINFWTAPVQLTSFSALHEKARSAAK